MDIKVRKIGGLKYNLHAWKKITQDQWVLDAVSGYCIHFDIQPCQHKIPKEIPFEKEHWQIVDLEIKTLLSKKAINNSVHENKSLYQLFL